jgi:AGZA family xanthine/uracil permease-like MFS transporter
MCSAINSARTSSLVCTGGILGFLPFFVDWIPASAVAPILVYIGLEVIAQAFLASPRRHSLAVAISLLPSFAFLAQLEANSVMTALGANSGHITGDAAESLRTLNLLGSGFIITAILWGAATASLIDCRFRASALYLITGAFFSLFGIIHSPAQGGSFVLPWKADASLSWHFAAAYLLGAGVIAGSKFLSREDELVNTSAEAG